MIRDATLPCRPHFASMMLCVQIAKAGVLYFALVFGAGFLLGPVRILCVAPQLGTRMAELVEAPIMLAVSIIAARWIVGKFCVPPVPWNRIAMGCLALSLTLAA